MSGELCGVCGAALRAEARFCGRCGAEQGVMVPRDAGAGPALREPRAPAPPLDGRGLGLAIGLYFVVLAPSLYFVARARGLSLGELDAIEWICGAAGLVALVALGRAQLGALGPGRWSARGAALAVAATAILVGAVELLARAVPSWFLSDRVLFGPYGLGTVGLLLHTALLPAVTEELAFRGAVLGGLRGVLGDRTAIVVSALMFAILHLSLPSLPHLALLGVILGVVRVKSGSVWPCVLIHAGYNAAVLLLST